MGGSVSSELIEAEAELVVFAVGEEVLPRDFALLEAGHAAEHAAERGFNACGDLVVNGAGDDAGDEGTLLVSIGELEVVEEGAVSSELARAGSGRCGVLIRPGVRAGDGDGTGVRTGR
jgi:hypothetical protein